MRTQDTTTGWQLDERAAEAYERNMVPTFTDPGAADLIEVVELAPGEHVLDVACGTGIVARHAARRVAPGGEVTGVDVNAPMLAVARRLATGPGAPVRWEQAPADDLPFPDASFDAVLCQQGLQFFPDPAAALAEMRRVARLGARVGVSTWRSIEHQPGYLLLAETVTRHLGVPAGEVIRSPYGVGTPQQLRLLFTHAGFEDIHLRIRVWTIRFASAEELLRAETSSSPLGDIVAALDPDVRHALVSDLRAALLPHTDDDGVVFPFESIVVTASR